MHVCDTRRSSSPSLPAIDPFKILQDKNIRSSGFSPFKLHALPDCLRRGATICTLELQGPRQFDLGARDLLPEFRDSTREALTGSLEVAGESAVVRSHDVWLAFTYRG